MYAFNDYLIIIIWISVKIAYGHQATSHSMCVGLITNGKILTVSPGFKQLERRIRQNMDTLLSL